MVPDSVQEQKEKEKDGIEVKDAKDGGGDDKLEGE